MGREGLSKIAGFRLATSPHKESVTDVFLINLRSFLRYLEILRGIVNYLFKKVGAICLQDGQIMER